MTSVREGERRVWSWPEADEPGRFTATCSCGQWSKTGTVAEINTASRSHDDSPFRQHIVSVRGKVIEPAVTP